MKPSRRIFAQNMLAASAFSLFPSKWRFPLEVPQTEAASGSKQRPYSRFVDIAEKAGLIAPMIYGGLNQDKYIIESMGGGCAFFDYDNDGWMDIFIACGKRLENTPPGASNRLYKNNRDGTFTDVTETSGLKDTGWASGVCIGDFNNDGNEDLFCTYFGQNRLYRNNGNGTFTDITKQAGLLDERKRFGTGCTFLDYNRDGFLDLFVANYVQFDLDNAPLPSASIPNCSYEGVAVYCGPRGMVAGIHSLYRNNGDGTFTDVSKESGIAAVHSSYALTAVAADFDEDGWPDIFVASDSTPSLLFMNQHDGTFREEGLQRGVAVSGDGAEYAGMGVGVGDYRLDGHLDIFKTHYQRQPSGLYQNLEKGHFEDVSGPAGLTIESRYVSWGAGIVDLDNDGWPDLFLVTGNVYPELEKVYPELSYKGPRILFRNMANGTFERLIDEAGPGIFARHPSRGCAFGDFDNDGDLDMVIMNVNEAPSLLRNDAPKENRWIKVRLIGTKSNRSAIGARLLVSYGKYKQAQALMSQSSYLSCNDPRLHFGLGAESLADIEVHWPNGLTEVAKQVPSNKLITFKEGAGMISAEALKLNL
jgi:enediyne biosynthesis protein E4